MRVSDRLFIGIFGIVIAAGLLTVAGINVYYNPWGNYGPRGCFSLYNARLAKSEHLNALPPDNLPACYVLGSSNVMRYMPETIASTMGMDAFNFGVFWGRMDDIFCISSFLCNDLPQPPRLLLIGMDTWTLRGGETDHPIFPGLRRRLLNCQNLVKYHPDVNPINLTWAKGIDAVSLQQTMLSLRYLRSLRTRGGQAALGEEGSAFNSDGTRRSYGDPLGQHGNIRELVDTGVYDINNYLQPIAAMGDPSKFPTFTTYQFQEFWDKRLTLLTETVELCQANNVEIIFILNPVHPVFRKVIEKSSQHTRHLGKLVSMLKDLEQKYPAVRGVVDASRIEYFDGDDRGFYDEIHPSSPNGDLILRKVADLYHGRQGR